MSHADPHAGELRRALQESTRPLHDQVEATNFMGRLMHDDLTPAEYARTMRALHALYVPLEDELGRVPGLRDAVPDFEERLKSESLAKDLRALPPSESGEQIVRPPAIEPITSVAAALGTLYVLEGSTMGGRLIASKLKARVFVAPGSLHFFEHYGAHANRYWQTFVKALDTVSADQFPAATAAARRTFGYFLALA